MSMVNHIIFAILFTSVFVGMILVYAYYLYLKEKRKNPGGIV